MRIPDQSVTAFLKQTSLLRGCTPEVLAKLTPHMEQKSFDAGQKIVVPGSATAGLGFLYKGRATMRLVNAASGADVALEELALGDAFGEIGLLLGGASPFAVVAEEACITLNLRKDHSDMVLAQVPAVALALAKRLSSSYVKATLLGSRPAAVAKGFAPATVPLPPAPAPTVPLSNLKKDDIRFVDVGAYNLTRNLLDLLPARVIQEQRVLPLELRGKIVTLGMVNPFSLAAKQEIRRMLHNVDPEYVAISQDDFLQALVRLKMDAGDRPASGQAAAPRHQKPQYFVEQKKEADKAQLVIGDEVVSLLDRILLDALDAGASEVHIEPEAASVRVRLRVQGVLHERKELVASSFAAPLVARIKVLAELDITERRLPQDGRIAAQLGRGREVNFRVATLTTARGEKVVVRILDPSDVMRPVEQLFADSRIGDMVQNALAAPSGALIVAGPSGSGKSSTIYSLINQRKLSRPDHNIVTVEDPVEYLLPGVSQVSVNAKFGLDFPTAIRALMRQDPDVVMIGELRDATSAGITLEAALTGHLVMTTLHASSVAGVLQRLSHFGLDATLLSQALNLILVQKLVRKLCPSCVREEEVAPALLEGLAERHLVSAGVAVRLPRAVGCAECDNTGYRGRILVAEALVLDDELRSAVAKGSSASELVALAGLKQFVSFPHTAKLLMARKLLSTSDALMVVAG